MKLPALILRTALTLSSLAVSGANAQSFVWKVTHGDDVLYLGGTVHVLREGDFPLPAEFDVAFAAADELWFEVDLAEMKSPAALGLMLRDSVLPEGETLEAKISPEAWTALADYCGESGLSLATMGRFKPGMLMMNIQMFEFTKLGLHQQGVEMHYANKALVDGKRTHGLETLAEQMGFLEDVGAENPSELILQTIRDLRKSGPMLDSAIDAWRRGDLGKMDDAILKEMEADAPEVAEKLIGQRNRNWVSPVMAMFDSEPVELVLVGAGHLPGPGGLIALLTAQGCGFEQIVADAR